MAYESRGVSFVVPAYNCARFLPEAISSIQEGNLRPVDEIVIVDDASTDSTPEVIERIRGGSSQIRTFRHPKNKGSAAAARNTALENISNELIFCLDADNLLPPGTLAPLLEEMAASCADVVAVGVIRYFSEAGPSRPTHEWRYKPGTITLADALAGHAWPGPSGNYLYTRASWLKAGRYPEDVGGGIDSWAFGIRQLATGAKFVTRPGTSYLHRYGHESASTKDQREGRISQKALQVIRPFFDHLAPESVEYILGPGALDWYEKLDQHPLLVKGLPPGATGEVIGISRGIVRDTASKVRRWLRGAR